MDGKDSNVGGLKEAMQAYDATTKTGRYANAKEKYVETTIVLSKQWPCLQLDPTVKQEQINQALAESLSGRKIKRESN